MLIRHFLNRKTLEKNAEITQNRPVNKCVIVNLNSDIIYITYILCLFAAVISFSTFSSVLSLVWVCCLRQSTSKIAEYILMAVIQSETNQWKKNHKYLTKIPLHRWLKSKNIVDEKMVKKNCIKLRPLV